jgi:CheY-like chemotaxis protein
MGRTKSVLIVEDEAVMAMYLEIILKRKGYVIAGSVSTGDDAVEVSVKNMPEFILMDIRLGGEVDGIEAARKICSTYKCKIIFMTGYSNDETIARANELQPVAYLVKPFDTSELLTILEQSR